MALRLAWACRSTMRTRLPSLRLATAVLKSMVVLPTPPLWLKKQMVFMRAVKHGERVKKKCSDGAFLDVLAGRKVCVRSFGAPPRPSGRLSVPRSSRGREFGSAGRGKFDQ